MTIKKPTKTQDTAPVENMAVGGATIADRFKLDITDPALKANSSSGVAATIAAIAGFIALGVVGVLVFVIYQHWQYLANA